MSQQAIRAFLLNFKHAVTSGSGVYLISRDVNRQTLNYLGLTRRNLEDILPGLTVLDYCKGPKPNRDQSGEIWEFGVDVGEVPVYTKLNVADVEGTKIAKCMSFHITKDPMKFPHQKKGSAK